MEPEAEDPPTHPPCPVHYVNYLQIGRTAREIILEFGQYHKGDSRPRIYARLVTHPAYAEEFLLVLAKALSEDSSHTDVPQ
jgi:hypothetical protein